MSAVYILMGAGDSGRGEFIVEMIRNGFASDDGPFLVFFSAEDAAAAPEAYAALAEIAGVSPHRFADSWPQTDALPQANGGGAVLLSLDGHSDPRDQLEAAKDWMEAGGHELHRIITVVDCTLARDEPRSLPWYEACLHFSDVILLGNRPDDAKKWVHDFEKSLHRKALPGLVRLLKKGGRLEGWAEILFPEARRLSLFFDPPEDLPTDDDEDAEEAEEDAPLPGDAATDPVLQRNDTGQRRLRLPDIRSLLGAAPSRGLSPL